MSKRASIAQHWSKRGLRCGGYSGPRGLHRSSSAPVPIFESNDIVFAYIAAALHFDHHQIELARILEAMLMTRRNEGRFVGSNQRLLLAVGHERGARHDHPMFAPVIVHLQT